MAGKNLDKRFCTVALDALKSFRHKEFTVDFLEKHKLRVRGNLTHMWAEIQRWVDEGDDSRCVDLLEYVDDLKMWGRQRIFLFEVNRDKEEFMTQLSDPDFVKGLVGDVYGKPIYRWKAGKPFLADVRHTTDNYTKAPLLVFKIVEMRTFDQLTDGSLQQLDERSTNFFIINLESGIAELRLQQLPVRAHRRLKDERELFEAELRKYLDFDRFKRVPLEPVMSEMIRRPIYTITSTEFISSEDAVPGVPTLVTVIHHLFEHPIPGHMAAYWECEQKVLGESRLHFRLYGSSDSIAFGGVADPRRVRDILQEIVAIHRGEDKEPIGSLWKRGLVDAPYKSLTGQPRAQAVVLSAGAIAALLIWIIIEGVGNYLLEAWVESILGGFPLIVITLLIELIWTVRFYGWNRIKRSLEALRSIPPSKIWNAFRKARSGDLARYDGDWGDRDDEVESRSQNVDG